jgi:hypothetical protein
MDFVSYCPYPKFIPLYADFLAVLTCQYGIIPYFHNVPQDDSGVGRFGIYYFFLIYENKTINFPRHGGRGRRQMRGKKNFA